MSASKITPFIWFTADGGSLTNLLAYYQTVFGSNFKAGQIIPLGETPSGKTEMCDISLFNTKYSIMSTGKAHHALNDAISFVISCDDQNEIDHFWNYFTQEGKESQCGWCIDKYNLRWQIIPKNMGDLMSRPNSNAVMMKQTKIIIAEYLK